MKVKICLFVNQLELYQVSKPSAARLYLYNPPTNRPCSGDIPLSNQDSAHDVCPSLSSEFTWC